MALEPYHVGLECGEVTEEELEALRDALSFCREHAEADQAARAYPSVCTCHEATDRCSGPG